MACGRMVVESPWLQWLVAAGCGKPSFTFFTDHEFDTSSSYFCAILVGVTTQIQNCSSSGTEPIVQEFEETGFPLPTVRIRALAPQL